MTGNAVSPRIASLLLGLALAAAPWAYGAVQPWAEGMLIALLAVIGWLGVRPGSLGLGRRESADLLLVIAFVALTAVSVAWAAVGPLALERALVLAGLLAAFLVAARQDEAGATRLSALMVGVAFVASVYGLVETLSGHDQVLGFVKRAYRGSVTGSFINRNHFASFTALCLYIALGLAALPGARRAWRAAAAGAAAVLAATVALTLSRGGVLAALAALPVFLWLLRAPRRPSCGALGLAVLAVVGAGVFVWSTGGEQLARRFRTSFDSGEEVSVQTRLSLWRSTLAAFGDRPLLGWGPGSFQAVYPLYREAEVVGRVQHAHNDALELIAERGVTGALLALACALWLARPAAVRQVDARRQALAAGLGAGLTAVGLHALVDFSLKIPAVALYAATAAGLLRALARPASSGVRRRRLVAVALALVWVVVAARAASFARSDWLRRQADAAFEQLAWKEADELYTRALAYDPWNLSALGGRARASLNLAKFSLGADERRERAKQAILALERARELNPLSAEYPLQQAWLETFLGREAQARSSYELAVARDPNNASILYQYGFFLLHRGELEPGSALMARAVRILPRLFGGKVHELDRLLGDPLAVSALIPEDQPFLAYQYATFLLDQQRVEESLPVFEQAFVRGGRPSHWLVPYSESLARQAGPGQAVQLIERLAGPEADAGVYNQKARLLRADGRSHEALLALERGLGAFPADAGLLGWIVTQSIMEKAPHRAEAALELFRAAGGDPAAGAVQRARLLAYKGEHAEAARVCEQALGERPGQPELARLLVANLRAWRAQAEAQEDVERVRQLDRRLVELGH